MGLDWLELSVGGLNLVPVFLVRGRYGLGFCVQPDIYIFSVRVGNDLVSVFEPRDRFLAWGVGKFT